jgi:hypothetical protein
MEARQRAGVDFRYRLTHRLALAADAELSTTHTPSELNTETALTLTRAVAQRVAAHSSMTRQLNKATAAAIDYRFASYRIAGGFETRTHDAAIGADRHVSSRDTVSLDYRLREFDFGTSSATSHALGFGWTRAITRRTSVSVDAGPRLTNGSPAPDLSASLRYQLTPGDLAVAYARTQTTVIGLAGVADTQSLTVTSAWSPRPSLQVRVSPAFYRSTQAALRANVYHVGVGIARPLADGLSLDVAFDADLQDGSLYTPLAKARIPRRDVVIRLVAAPAARPR